MKTITRNEYIYLNSVKNGRSMSGVTLQITDEEYEDLIQYRIGQREREIEPTPEPDPESVLEAYMEYRNKTMTFYYDKLRNNRTGQIYDLNIWHEEYHDSSEPDWVSLWANDNIDRRIQDAEKIIIDESFSDYNPITTKYWFFQPGTLTSIEGLEYLNTSEVRDMEGMFMRYNGATVDISNFNTCKVEKTRMMFYGCENLISLDLSNFDTSNVYDMSYMFAECYKLEQLDISNFDYSNIQNIYCIDCMFENCTSLNPIPDIDIQGTHKRITSYEDLEEGASYIIVCETKNMAMAEQGSNIRNYVSLTTTNGAVTTEVNKSGKPYEFTLGTYNGKYTLYDETGKVYLALTKNENKLHTATSNIASTAQWTITFSGNNVIIQNAEYTDYSIRYNNDYFACYKSSINSVTPIQLYKRVEIE